MILDEESSDGTVTEVDLSETPRTDGSFTPATPEHSSDDGIPTGNILLNTGPIPASPRTLVAQAAIIIGAALLVGTVVFLAVQAAVGSDSDDDILDESAVIDPGPSGEIPGLDDSSRSGSRRETPGDGRARVDEERDDSASDAELDAEIELDAPTAAAADVVADVVADEVEAQEEAAAADPLSPTAPSTTVPLGIGSPGGGELQPTTSTPKPFGPVTTTIPVPNISFLTTPPTAGTTSTPPVVTTIIGPATSEATSTSVETSLATSTTLTSSSSTTATTVPVTTTTATAVTTTSTTTATTAPPPPPALIALPADGSIRQWETITSFRAEAHPNATKYCWTLLSGAGQRQDCIADLIFDLAATPTGVLPGPLSVKAEAFDTDGTLLSEDQISIDLLVSDVAASPASGADLARTDGMSLASLTVPSATRYCWTVSQGVTTSGEVCETGESTTIAGDDARLDGIGLGTTRIRFTAYRGLDLIGSEEVLITLS